MTEPRPTTWNYRVRASTIHSNVPGVEPEEKYELVEVYYDEDGSVCAWGDNDGPLGNSLSELRRDYRAMAEAFDKPILEEEDFPLLTEASRLLY